MSYQAQDYSDLFGMQGFSEQLLKNHFTLYNEYAKNANEIMESLDRLLAEGQAETLEFASLKNRMGWESDSMSLHELYFENLGGRSAISLDSSLVKKIEENFGSYEAWEADFRATASIGGVGWAMLCQDNSTGTLNNFWIDEHHVGHSVDRTPLLVLDAWEHSYMLDYGLKRPDYIENFLKNIDWDVVNKRVKG
ncbi:MAG: Manganese/iron superoxide dismutase [Firmicutes bacterium]|nr:Manganese/iron superoxide dismutase [Bacillota bacterium]